VGYYARECEGFDWLDREEAGERITDLMSPIRLPTRHITCVRCGAAAEVPYAGVPLVRAQVSLWCDGWRRDPDSGYDYCPHCQRRAAEAAAPT